MIEGKLVPEPNNVPDLVEERVHEVLPPKWIRERFVIDENVCHLVREERPRHGVIALARLVVFD